MMFESQEIRNLKTRVDAVEAAMQPTCPRDWQIIKPLNDDHLAIAAKTGLRIGNVLNVGSVSDATGAAYDEEGRLWIVSFNNFGPRRLNENLEVDLVPPITYGTSSTTNDWVRWQNNLSMTDDGTKLILACNYTGDCVRIYQRESGELLSTIGIPGAGGNLDAGRVNSPHSAIRLPNGNIVVSCFQARGPGATGDGSISEWDVSTPIATLVATHMQFDAAQAGQSAVGNNQVFRPMEMFWDPDQQHVWISEYGRGRILKVDTNTWSTVELFESATGGADLRDSYSVALFSNNVVAAAPNRSGRIAGLDRDTRQQVWEIDVVKYTGNSVPALRDCFEIEPGFAAWFDTTANGMFVAPIEPIVIPYEPITLEPGFAVETSNLPGNFDIETFELTVQGYELDQVGPLVILKQQQP